MQLIQRTTLVYQEGRSDKVYEVDLGQIGADRFVVNFRYGRRGGKLREGSETVAAVPQAEAQRIFDRLVQSKVRKGYREDDGTSAPTIAEPLPALPVLSMIEDPRDRRKANILYRLNQAVEAPNLARASNKEWQLGRVIWRAGELGLGEAVPALLRLIGNDALKNYSIAWALGRCGDRTALPALQQLYESPHSPDHLRRIALEAIFKLDAEARDRLRTDLIQQLPEPLQHALSSPEAFTTALRESLTAATYRDFPVLDRLYQIDHAIARPALLEILRSAPLQPNYFKPLRHIFKIAEYRHDVEVLSILAYRFEKVRSVLPTMVYDRATRSYTAQDSGIPWARAVNPKDPETCVAFQRQTREYLRRRIWRSLRRLGQLNAPEYVTLATRILLQYSDADADSVKNTTRTRWERPNGNDSHWVRHEYHQSWDKFARYIVFNHILYENSPRYILKHNTKAWRCQPPYKPGDPEPTQREEAFPQLWEQHPTELLRLLLNSRCQPVHQFAAKALRSCSQFCANLELTTLIQLLESPYEATAQFSFELARSRYQPEQPNQALLIAIANCNYAPARSQVHQWILDQRDRFLADSQFIAELLLSLQADTRSLARQLLSHTMLANEASQRIIAHIIAKLITLNTTQGEIAEDTGETLLLSFSQQLRTLGLDIVLDLLRHPLAEVQTFGARVLLNHETPAIDLPAGLIDALLDSSYSAVRVVGVRLFGQLPDRVLLQQVSLIVKFATHELPDMRESIRPAIRRLAAADSNFRTTLSTTLLEKLLLTEEHEGVHAFLMQVLQTDLLDWKTSIAPERTLQLLQAESSAAQEIAGAVLEANCLEWSTQLEIGAIAQLTHHEVLSIRNAAKAMFQQLVPTLRGNEDQLLTAVLILESRWDDARKFGQTLFGELLQPTDLTPSVVISICDNNRAEVRRFGRDLVSRCFHDRDGQSYLLKFSEHPATDMQLFATQYLETHVADHPDRLQALMPYVMRVLSQVNRGRVAKQRIFAFLNAEAIKHEAAARAIAEVLTRQSATIAISDRARALETLLKIHHNYPDIPVPIQVKPIALKA